MTAQVWRSPTVQTERSRFKFRVSIKDGGWAVNARIISVVWREIVYYTMIGNIVIYHKKHVRGQG